MTCPFHPDRPADAAFSNTCSVQCERLVSCGCGGTLYCRSEGEHLVLRCAQCGSAETLSQTAIQHLAA